MPKFEVTFTVLTTQTLTLPLVADDKDVAKQEAMRLIRECRDDPDALAHHTHGEWRPWYRYIQLPHVQ